MIKIREYIDTAANATHDNFLMLRVEKVRLISAAEDVVTFGQ